MIPISPATAAKIALRSVARRVATLADEAAELAAQVERLVATTAPTTLERLGLGIQNTADLLVAARENIERFNSEAAFAYSSRTGGYMKHRLSGAKTKKEAIRCLKRYVAREVYPTSRADFPTLLRRA